MAVTVLTQIAKGIAGINRLPTQLWSYLLSLATLLLALTFGAGWTASGAVLAFLNATLERIRQNLKADQE